MSSRTIKVDPAELTRFVEAVALGEIADAVFYEECWKRDLSPRACLRAPLAFLGSCWGGKSAEIH